MFGVISIKSLLVELPGRIQHFVKADNHKTNSVLLILFSGAFYASLHSSH